MWVQMCWRGADALQMAKEGKLMLEEENRWRNPFGDGQSGKRILKFLTIGLRRSPCW